MIVPGRKSTRNKVFQQDAVIVTFALDWELERMNVRSQRCCIVGCRSLVDESGDGLVGRVVHRLRTVRQRGKHGVVTMPKPIGWACGTHTEQIVASDAEGHLP